MKTKNIYEVRDLAVGIIKCVRDIETSVENSGIQKINPKEYTTASAETATLKRRSMDLTRALSKMRNDI